MKVKINWFKTIRFTLTWGAMYALFEFADTIHPEWKGLIVVVLGLLFIWDVQDRLTDWWRNR